MNKVNKKNLFPHEACSVGEFISSELNNSLIDSYEKEFPGVLSNFTVSRQLIEKVLSQHEEITGLEFAMGLKDILNPNSSKVVLIPCTHSKEQVDPIPLVSDRGYYDLKGELVSIPETCKLIANQAAYRKVHNQNLVYKDIERFSFVGRDMLFDLLSIPECDSFSFQFGFENNKIATILSPLDVSGKTINDIYADRMGTKPPLGQDGGGECVAELALSLSSNEKELIILREFRDNQLLTLENGNWLYEMYYFISPLVALKINKSGDKRKIVEDLCFKIRSMIQCIESENYDKLMFIFKSTLEELVHEYQEELVY